MGAVSFQHTGQVVVSRHRTESERMYALFAPMRDADTLATWRNHYCGRHKAALPGGEYWDMIGHVMKEPNTRSAWVHAYCSKGGITI
jgi:hypothetical protein